MSLLLWVFSKIRQLLRKLRFFFKKDKATTGTAKATLYIKGNKVAHSKDFSYNFTGPIDPIKVLNKGLMIDLPIEFEEVLDKEFWNLLA